jgi:hypothetical protein
MPDEPIPRMYGITCPNTKNGVHVHRLGKEILAPSATDADLRAVLVARYQGNKPGYMR